MAKTAQRQGIKTAPLGEPYVGFCVVRRKEIRYKQDGRPYLVLEFGDWSGRLKARIWENVQQWDRHIPEGAIVKIKAIPQMFNDLKELKVQKIRLKREQEQIDIHQLLPSVNKNVSELKSRFHDHLFSVRHGHLRQLLDRIFADDGFKEQYFLTPGGKLWHHVYLYGMLDHVVGMLEVATALSKDDPWLHMDLLKTGIILHDIGKVWELDISRGFIELSDQGRLFGHVVRGFSFVERHVREMGDFPSELWLQLGHMILSHPGEPEKGAPVVPMTREAMALSLINQLDGNLNALQRILRADVPPGSKWSKFVPLLGRFIHVSHPAEQNHQTEDQEQMHLGDP
ncbi:MAG: HD domain-containing protein [Calditrichaeota bacterium]|nr:HD domain-containing protein [Calditrichota bacterium]